MEALLSTTHQLTPLKRHILDAVDATESMVDGDGTTVQQVRDWLNDNDIPHPKENTLRDRMSELSENYYLQSYDNAGGKNGQATVYERHDEGALQTPDVRNLGEKARRRDGIELATEDCVDIDPTDPFDGCTDPIRDQPFKQTVTELDTKFSSGTVEGDSESIDMMDAMGGDDSEETGQSSLTDVSEDGVDSASADEEATELDPSGDIDDPTEQWVLEALRDAEHDPYGESQGIAHYVDAVSYTETVDGADTDGTVVDPDHELWNGRPDLRDDRVIDETDTLRELADAYGRLKRKGYVVEDDDGGPMMMYTLRVAGA
jgi:hypothetical protein